VAPTPGMGTLEARMEPKRDRASSGSDGGRREPMDEGGTRSLREEGLHGKIAAGQQARLTPEQLEQLPRLLEQGAEAHGFAGAVWTTERVAVLINKQFGVSYHPAHMSRLLKRIKYSVQQPIERANQRDEQAIEVWKQERWPALKKSPARRQNDHFR
jgi:transposase